MKKYFCLLLVFVITGIIFAPVSLSPSVQTEVKITSVRKSIKVDLPRPFFRLESMLKVTNYIPEENAITSTGKIAKWGIVAVNPKEIPLGSVIYIANFPGQKFIANDTIGKKGIEAGVKIDVCRDFDFPLKDAKEFGGKTRRVTIVTKKPLAG